MSTKNLSDKKPLPPIGLDQRPDDDVTSNRSDSEAEIILDRLESRQSVASSGSSAALDRPGEGKARPAIIRGFRREVDTPVRKVQDRVESPIKRAVTFTPDESKTKPPVSNRESMKRTTYDGREITFITQDVQTDWDWLESATKTGRARSIAPSDNESVTKEAGKDVQGSDEDVEGKNERPEGSKTGKPDISKGAVMDPKMSARSSFPYLFSDEFGIPMLELSSDTDSSSDEETSHHKKSRDNREFMPSIGPPQILQYIRESEQHIIKVDDPNTRIEELSEEEHDYPVDEHGRPMGMFGGICEFCGKDIKPFPTKEQQEQFPPEELFCCNSYREFVEFTTSKVERVEEEEREKNKIIDVKVHPHHGDKQARKAARERAEKRMREREMQRRQQEASGMQQQAFLSAAKGSGPKGSGMPGQNVMYKDMVARQMKTINYMLSSQRCLEEGWTLRAPSPLLPDETDDIFIPEPLNPAMIASGNLQDRMLIEKYYEDGQKFLTMFPDGTGSVFYPSGNLAMSISSVTLGQYTYVIQDDTEKPFILAVFEPNGFASCYHPNGFVRLCLDQMGGIELTVFGGKKRKWLWKDQETHVHAPPFQPITFGLNKCFGVRIMSQDNIAVTFGAKQRSCRFNVGSKLKLVAPENIPPKEIDDNLIFLEEKKNKVESLLDRVATLLKFPKSPKVDKILPPLSLTSRVSRTEKIKKEKADQIAAQEAKKVKQPSIVVT